MPIYPSLRAAVGRDRAAREGCKNSSSGLRHRGGPADEGLVAVPPRLARTRRDRIARAARWAISTAAALGAGGVLLFFSQPAAALVTKTEGGESVGITPREAHFYRDASVELKGLETGEAFIDEATASFTSNGAPVLHSANTYAIYWDPQAYYHGYWEEAIDGFMANMGNASGSLSDVFATDTQYTDSTNTPATGGSAFHGAYTDFNPYPEAGCEDPHPFEGGAPEVNKKPVCLTDAQVRAQLSEFITQHSLPKGMGTVYYLLTPPGVAVCLDTGGVATGHCSEFGGTFKELEEEEKNRQGAEEAKSAFVPSGNYESYERSFCSYHGAIGEGSASTVLYAMIPWTAGGAGDGHLFAADQTSDYPCQDGGFEPFTKPTGEPQEKEREKEKTPLEIEEFNKKNAKEKREAEEAEALGLTGPHLQEPNQLGEVIDVDSDHDLGLSDVIINQIATQQQNAVTDPLLNAWQDSSGKEVMDECRNNFEPKPGGAANAVPTTRSGTLFNQTIGKDYYLNDAFNMAGMRLPYPAVTCLQGVTDNPVFTAPNAVNANEIVGFNGMESSIYLNSTLTFPSKALTYPTFTWNFGDGTPEVGGFAPGSTSENSPASSPCPAPWIAPCAASTFHSYTYGGTYQVTLTVKDVGGHVNSVTQPITVVGPQPPAAAGSGSGQLNGSGGAGTGAPGSGPGGSPGGVHHTPVATAAILSRSLRRALRKGIVIRFSVNEALAGHVEVMLAASIARRRHIAGASAVGLPAGTPPQTIIAKSVLITAKGGTGTLTLHVGSKTAERLRRLHKASFLMRLMVRNGTGGNVIVLAPATLAG